jgi:hypothetical protein
MKKLNLKWLRVTSVLGFLAALLCSACEKTELPPSVTEPTIFSVTDSLNQIALTAGLGKIYLYTDVERDAAQVLVFSGTFAEAGCAPVGSCRGSMRFEFRNLNPDAVVFPEEAFRVGEREYADLSSGGLDTIYRTFFTAPNGYGAYAWVFDSVNKVSGKSVIRDFQNAQPVRVALSMSGGGFPTSLSRWVSISDKEIFPAVRLSIEKTSSDTNYLIGAVTSGLPVVQYEWWPDSTQSKAEYKTAELKNRYAVTVTDAPGNTASVQVDSTFGVADFFQSPDFTHTVQPIVTGDPLQLGQVAIQWVDAQGTVWRSDRAKQTQGAQFQVLSSEPYEANEKGQKTYKMTLRYRCSLYSPALQAREFGGTAVIGVAY